MQLRRLEIENFRGIKNLDLALGATTVLIGENNTGKTAVFDAMRFALRVVRTQRGCAFNEYDFHLPTSTAEPSNAPAISIKLTFKEDEPGQWDDLQVARLNRLKILQIGPDGCALVILKVSAAYDLVTREFIQDWEFQNFDGMALTSLSESALGVFHAEVSYFYLSALRNATKEFDAKGPFWRPFLKESQLSPENQAEIETKLSEVNDLIISSHTSFSQVVSHLKKVQEIVAMTSGEDVVSVNAVPGRLFDVLAKAEVNLNSGTGAKIPVGRHGEGIQSLAVLMLFNAYLQAWNKGDAIVALEEPEAHLHPSAVRTLWQLIEKIPGQKFISTHSGDLLSEVPSSSVVRLHVKEQSTKVSKLGDSTLNPSDTIKFNYHIRRDRGALLFSRCWILGEGETEATLIPESARILGKDIEKAGIRFVAYQSGISLETCLKVANSMGIQWVVLVDNDIQGTNDSKAVRRHLDGRSENDVLFVIQESNIEQHLCNNGFAEVYYKLLSPPAYADVTATPRDDNFSQQVGDALSQHKFKQKTGAAHEVLDMIGDDRRLVPQMFRDIIDTALNLAGES